MSQAPKTFEEALAAFEALESELGLPEWKIKGICAWKIQRHYMFRAYREHLGLMDVAHPEQQRLRRTRTQMIWDFPKPFLFHNPFFKTVQPTQRVVIPTARKRACDGILADPISYPAWRPPNNKTATVIDRVSPLYPTMAPSASSFDVLARIAWIGRQAVSVRLGPEDRYIVREISKRLFGSADSSSIEFQFRKTVKAFIGLRNVFTALLKRIRPSYLYVVCSYGCEAPISAARHLGIETVEFQHGSVGRGHAGYDFKNWSIVPYFPDRILAFGIDWFRDVHIPESCTIDPVGYPFIEDTITEANARTTRRPNQLLAISQGPIADQLLKAISVFLARRPDWQVVIKPHPSESPGQLRQRMTPLAKTNNWYIGEKLGLQDYSAACSVVFGVNSTALIESLLAGCRVAVLDTPMVAGYFDSLVREGHAAKVQDGEELAKVIDDLPKGSARGYFAPPVEDIVAYVEGSVGSQD